MGLAIMIEVVKTMTLKMLINMYGQASLQSSDDSLENETTTDAGVSLAKTGNFTRKAAGGSFQV